MELKIGDKVKIIAGKSADSERFNGKIITIKEINQTFMDKNRFFITGYDKSKMFDHGIWFEELELVVSKIDMGHYHLLTGFDSDLSIEEELEECARVFSRDNYLPSKDNHSTFTEGFIAGAKSEAARHYWYQQFINAQK